VRHVRIYLLHLLGMMGGAVVAGGVFIVRRDPSRRCRVQKKKKAKTIKKTPFRNHRFRASLNSTRLHIRAPPPSQSANHKNCRLISLSQKKNKRAPAKTKRHPRFYPRSRASLSGLADGEEPREHMSARRRDDHTRSRAYWVWTQGHRRARAAAAAPRPLGDAAASPSDALLRLPVIIARIAGRPSRSNLPAQSIHPSIHPALSSSQLFSTSLTAARARTNHPAPPSRQSR